MDQVTKKTESAVKKTAASAEKTKEAEKQPQQAQQPEKNNIQSLIEKAKAKGTLTNAEIFAALSDTDYDIDEIKVFEPSLNDIFVEYTEGAI